MNSHLLLTHEVQAFTSFIKFKFSTKLTKLNKDCHVVVYGIACLAFR